MHAHLFAPHIEPTGPAAENAAVLDPLHGALRDALDARLVRVRVSVRVRVRVMVRVGVRARVRGRGRGRSKGRGRGRGSRYAMPSMRASFSRAARAAICSATLPWSSW